MWVSSKQAAEILGIKYETIKKSAQRARKSGKKFCSINGQNCLLNMLDGNIGGASGKTLQIWIDDAVTNNDPNQKEPNYEKNSINTSLDRSHCIDSAAFCSAVDSAVSDGYIMDDNGCCERGGDSRNLLCGAQACEKIEAKSASQDQVKIKIEDE